MALQSPPRERQNPPPRRAGHILALLSALWLHLVAHDRQELGPRFRLLERHLVKVDHVATVTLGGAGVDLFAAKIGKDALGISWVSFNQRCRALWESG